MQSISADAISPNPAVWASREFVTTEVAKVSGGGSVDLSPYLKTTDATAAFAAKGSVPTKPSDIGAATAAQGALAASAVQPAALGIYATRAELDALVLSGGSTPVSTATITIPD